MDGFVMVVLEFLNHLTLAHSAGAANRSLRYARNCSNNARRNGSRSRG